MKLKNIIKIIAGIQIWIFALTLYMIAEPSDSSKFSGLGFLMPWALFWLLGFVNLLFILFHIAELIAKATKFDYLLAVLVLVNIILAIFQSTLFEWADKLAG